MHLRNDSGSPLQCFELGRDIGPGEELEHGSYITGCTILDAPEGGEKDEGKAKGGGGGGESGAPPLEVTSRPGTRTEDPGTPPAGQQDTPPRRRRGGSEGDQA